MNDLNKNLENVNARILRACQSAQRNPGDVRLLAVSKRQSVAKIRSLYGAGQLAFGENYVQEAISKQEQLGDLDIEWHFIGPIQSNKTRELARHFHWVHSVDREKILRRLSDSRSPDLPPLNICLQVNIDREVQKSGALSEEIPDLAQLAFSLTGIRLRGLMAIPRATKDTDGTLGSFRAMYALYEQLKDGGLPIDTLSMGMSSDIEQAIQAGSTLVRVGTALFGPRY